MRKRIKDISRQVFFASWEKIKACSTAGNGAYDKKRLRPCCDLFGQWSVRRFEGIILLAGEEPQEWPALFGDVVADCAPQHRIAGLKRVEDRPLRDRAFDVEFYLSVNPRQGPQMKWEHDSNHGSDHPCERQAGILT